MNQSQTFAAQQMQQALLEQMLAQLRNRTGVFGFPPGFASVPGGFRAPPQSAPPVAIEHDPAADAARTRALRRPIPAEQP